MEYFNPWPLPVRFSRQEGELTSSWIVRVADAHGQSVQSLGYRLVGRGRALFGEDVDRGAWTELLQGLARVTLQPLDDLYLGTLKAFEGFLWGSLPKQGPARWVLPIIKRGTARIGFGQQYCCECLATDRFPYLRQTWRLAFMTCCPIHRRWLLDRCPICGAPVVPHKNRTGRRAPAGESSITRCHLCGGDLRSPDGRSDVDISPVALEMQERLLAALAEGYCLIDDQPVHSVLFFSAMAMLWSMLDDDRRSGQLWQVLGSPLPAPQIPRKTRFGSFEKRLATDRARLLDGSARLLEGGAAEMVRRLEASGETSGTVFRYSGRTGTEVPFWLWEPVHLGLDRSIYVPSDKEILNAIDHAVSLGGKGYTTHSTVCELLGMRTRGNARVSTLMRLKRAYKWQNR